MELSTTNGHTNIDYLFISAVCFPVVRPPLSLAARCQTQLQNSSSYKAVAALLP